MPPKIRHQTGAAILLLAIVATVCTARAVRVQRHIESGKQQVDLQTFYLASATASHREDIYRFHEKARVYPYLYPPFFAVALRPLTLLSFPHAVLLWNLLQILLLLAAFALIRRFLLRAETPAPDLVAAVLLTTHLWALEENIIWVQVNLLLLVGLLGTILLLNRKGAWWAGGLLSLLVALKLTPLLFLSLLVWTDRRTALRFLVGFGLGLAAFLVLVPVLEQGISWTLSTTHAYLGLLARAARSAQPILPWGDNCANHSLLYGFHHLFGHCAPKSAHRDLALVTHLYRATRIGLAGGLAATTGLGLWLRIRSPKLESQVGPGSRQTLFHLTLAQAGLALILVSPIVWIHYWILGILPIMGVWVAGSAGLQADRQGDDRENSRAPAPGWSEYLAGLLAVFLAGITVAAPQLEHLMVGTMAFLWYGAFVAVTLLLLATEWSMVRKGLLPDGPTERLSESSNPPGGEATGL